MDYEFFESLSDADARSYFERYLEVESQEVSSMLEEAASDDVQGDFSLESIPGVVVWIARHIEIVRTSPPADTPAWVTEAMEEHGGFLDFDPASRPLVLRASYYIGQSFVSSCETLEWGVGRQDRAEAGQPVVTGFGSDADLPPLEVAENLLLGSDSSLEERVETAVRVWREAV